MASRAFSLTHPLPLFDPPTTQASTTLPTRRLSTPTTSPHNLRNCLLRPIYPSLARNSSPSDKTNKKRLLLKLPLLICHILSSFNPPPKKNQKKNQKKNLSVSSGYTLPTIASISRSYCCRLIPKRQEKEDTYFILHTNSRCPPVHRCCSCAKASFCMSENQLPPPQPTQAPPPASTPPPPQRTPALSSAADLQLRHESLSSPPPQTPQSSPQSPPAGGIEKRHILSPVSPRPVHVAESAALKNQMELAFTFPDAHPPHPPATSNDRSAVSPVSNSLESLMLQRQQQLHAPQLQQNHQQNPQHVPSPPPRSQQQPPQQGEAPSHANSAALVPAMDSSSSNSCTSLSFAQNGDVHAGDGLVASSPATTNGTAAGNPANTATAGLPLPSPIPDDFASSVDLQALLTKLSPAAPTVPQLLSSAPPAQSPPPTGPSVVASPSSAPSTIKAALPLSPVQKTPTPAPPTNHPLPPVPVVSSSLPGQPPAGYPSSLPPPPNFNHNKQSQSQSQPQPQPPQPQQAPQPQRQGSDAAAEDEEDEEDRLPFTVDEEEEFSRFLSDERDYVTQGQWDRFPAGSRLFIGAHPPNPLVCCPYPLAVDLYSTPACLMLCGRAPERVCKRDCE